MRNYFFFLLFIASTPLSSQTFVQSQKLVASDRGFVDLFGSGLDISGDYAVCGAFLEDEDADGLNTENSAGSAYIFERDSSGVWIEVAKLVPSDRDDDDRFGWSVAIDSNTAIICANNDEDTDPNAPWVASAGAAYIFERNVSGNWVEVQKIYAPERSFLDRFGTRVEILGDIAVAGAQREDHDENDLNPRTDAGSVYVFKRAPGGNWSLLQKLVAEDRRAGDNFGVSISASAERMIVGAYQQDRDTINMNSMTDAGAAYIFEMDSNGLYRQVQKLLSPDRDDEDRFGNEVYILGDYAAVAAYRDDDVPGMGHVDDAGSVYIYKRTLNGKWEFLQKINNPQASADEEFGSSLCMEGELLLVGSIKNNLQNGKRAGAAFMYKRTGAGNFNFVQKVVPDDLEFNDNFGWKASLSEGTLVVSANQEDESATNMDSLAEAGAFYAFELQLTCEAPSNLISSANALSAQLNWDNLPGAVSYTLRGTASGLDSNSYVYLNTSDTAITVNKLSPERSYYWQVSSNCSEESSPYSSFDTFTTLPLQCSVPQQLSVTGITMNSAILSWQGVPGAVNYVVRGSEGTYDKKKLVFVTSANAQIQVSGLSGGSNYFWQVQSVCNGATSPVSPFSQVYSFSTLEPYTKRADQSIPSIYPNPNKGNFGIELGNTEKSRTVQIIDLQGRIVQEINHTFDQRITITGLPSGVYMVKIQDGSDSHLQKVVVN